MFPSAMPTPYSDNTLDPKINQHPEDGYDNKAVLSALYTIQNNRDTKILRDSKNLLIQQLLEAGFEVHDPTGTRKLSSKKMQQVFWRGANRMKPLSARIFGSGRPKANQKIVTAGVRTVMDKGSFIESLRGKGGAYQKLLMWGNGFVWFGTNPDPEAAFPIIYSPVSNSNIYFDSYATGMRAGGIGRAVKKCVIIFSMSWADACAYEPWVKKKAAIGRIPRDVQFYKELERTYLQSNKLYDLIEIAYSFDISNKSFVKFAGPTCAVGEELKGKNYPFVNSKNKKPYIPILDFVCLPASEGIYDHGIGDMIYDLAVITARLMNMEIGHAEDNTYPITLVNVPKGEAAKFFNSLQSAGEMRAAGKKAFVPVEYDSANPGSGRVEANQLLTQNLMNEWKLIMDELDKEFSRLGINLDDLDYGSDLTASQVMAQDQNSNSLFQQIGEWNASEYQFAYESAMDILAQTVSKKDKTPLNLTVTVEDENGQKIPTDQITLGAVVDEIKTHNYFVEVDSRSGVVPSSLMENVQINNLLKVTQPGTKAYYKLLEDYATANNRDLTMEDFMPPQSPQPQESGAPQGQPGAPAPSETDRVLINPTAAKNPIAAL